MQQIRFIVDIDFDLLKSDGKTENAKFGFGEWFQVKSVQFGPMGYYNVEFLNGDKLDMCPEECIELHNCKPLPYVSEEAFTEINVKEVKNGDEEIAVTVTRTGDKITATTKVEKNDSDK